MATTVLSNPNLRMAITANLAISGGSSQNFTGTINHAPTALTPTIGTSAGNVNRIYYTSGTVDTGSPVSLDLSSTTDPAGGAIVLTRLYGFLFGNLSTTTAEIMTLGGGTNGFVATITLPIYPSAGALMYVCPTPGITIDGTHKIFTIAVASGTGVGYEVTILGHS